MKLCFSQTFRNAIWFVWFPANDIRFHKWNPAETRTRLLMEKTLGAKFGLLACVSTPIFFYKCIKAGRPLQLGYTTGFYNKKFNQNTFFLETEHEHQEITASYVVAHHGENC